MTANYFILMLALMSCLYLAWGFRVLPRERWQILAAMPVHKEESGTWTGVNFTWYGLLTANAYAVAVAVLIVLLGAVRVPLTAAAISAAVMLLFCVPASSLVARIVEKKAHTFTVGGAVFVGVLLAPWLIEFVNLALGPVLSFSIPSMTALAAFSIAYAFGEGFGRLACVSFGCCYGKPLNGAPAWTRRIFADCCFVFFGKTRKIAYAGGLEGEKVVPIQAVTAVIYVGTGLCATALFLHSSFAAAYLLSLAVTQGWRVLSETMRADYRGTGTFSAYQVMGLISIVYGILVILLVTSEATPLPDTAVGITALWHPAPLLFLQILWLAIFVHTGKSSVTGSTLSFHVHTDRI